jgi:small subunit ribosomal protein S4e
VSNVIYLKGVLVNGRKVDDKNYNVGLYDVVKMVSTGDAYRIYFNDKGKLVASKVDEKEESIKPSKIIKKTIMKGAKMQLNMSDGINLTITKGDYVIGDTLIFELPKLTVKEHIKLEKGAYVQIVAGKYLGLKGEVVDIVRYESANTDLITFKTDDGKEVSTLKSYAFALGKKKPLIFVGE